MPRVSKQEKRNAHEGLEAQASHKTQLRRLAHHLATFHRIKVEFRRKDGDKYPRMAILRPEHKPVVFRSGHPSERNLELLQGIAHCAVEYGGAGMSYESMRKVCSTPNTAADAPPALAVATVVAAPVVALPAPAFASPRGEGTVARAWAVADGMPSTSTRKEIVAAMVAAGIKPNTAAAQYVRWNKTNRGGRKF